MSFALPPMRVSSLKLGEQRRFGMGGGTPSSWCGVCGIAPPQKRKWIFTRKWRVVMHYNALFLAGLEGLEEII